MHARQATPLHVVINFLLAPMLLCGSTIAQSVGYVTRQSDNQVVVVDLNTGSVLSTIPTSSGPYEITGSPDGTTLYVTAQASDMLDYIDTATSTRTGGTPVGGAGPIEIAILPNGSKVYIANWIWGSVSVVDTRTRMKIADIPTNFLCYDVAASPDGRRVYATSILSTDVFVIDTATDEVIDRIPVGRTFMGHIALAPDGKKAYLSEFRGRVNVLDLASRTITKTILINTSNSTANNGLLDIEIDPLGRYAYALGTESLNVIDMATDTLIHTIVVGIQLSDVAVDRSGGHVYVTTLYQEIPSVPLNEIIKIETENFTIQNRFRVGGLLIGMILGSMSPPDNVPPALDLPDDITAEATGPSGARVDYNATAADDVDGTVAVTCDLPSSATYPLGNTVVTCTATDSAGNAATGSFNVRVVDTVEPSVNCGTTDGIWHAEDVNVICTASDGGSGLLNPADASFGLTTSVPANSETSNAMTVSREVCDATGNCTIAGPVGGHRVDKKGPQILISSPAAAIYTVNQFVAASYVCADGGSGLSNCSGPVANGAGVDTMVGLKAFTVTARDQVGNTSILAVGYGVTFGAEDLHDPTKAFKGTVKLEVRLTDADGVNLSSPSMRVYRLGLLKLSDYAPGEVVGYGEQPTTNDFLFRSDGPAGGRYQYDFKPKDWGLIPGTYVLIYAAAGDPYTHAAQFQVK